ncbi:MAG: hypothetical protein K8F58_00575 [Bauldia sp.]|nr:hypothetical protein [Bauldia sp.]
MRDISHLAAATIALGLLTDDLYGALLEAPSAQAPADGDGRNAFADHVAAGRHIREIDRDERPAKPRPRPATIIFN